MRIIGVPAPPPGNEIGFGVNAPPIVPPGGVCACANLSVAWFNGTAFAVVVDTDETPPAFALSGTICPGTSYVVTPAWEPDVDGAEPIVTRFGDSAWAVFPPVEGEPYDDGILTLNLVAICAGQTFNLGPIFLTIIQPAYYVNLCPGPPTEYTNIQDLFADCGVSPHPQSAWTFIDGSVFYHADGDTFTVQRGLEFPTVPFYNNTEIGDLWLEFTGLAELFAGQSMDVRFTVVSNSIVEGAYDVYIDDKHFPTNAEFDASWERTIADASTFITGAGVDDGAGSTGACVFRIEVRVTPP